jgi:hypothetical protein
MNSWIVRLKDVVWTAVFAVALAVLSILVALVVPSAISLVLALGLSSVSLALLSWRVAR